METKCFNSTFLDLEKASELLRKGGVVAFPTETVYGLGADATNTRAVEKIFKAKGRPADNPLITHIAHLDQMISLVKPLSHLEKKLIDAFWPGPLTLICQIQPNQISPLVTAGLSTMAIRMPACTVALQLIKLAGFPIAAPSANLSGKPSPTKAEHVFHDLSGKIDGIIYGGDCEVGLESTVVQVIDDQIHILRLGGISREQLFLVTDHVLMPTKSSQKAPISPGTKYRHYAPQGEMFLLQGMHTLRLQQMMKSRIHEEKEKGKRVAILGFTPLRFVDSGADFEQYITPQQAAHTLYDTLRICDEKDIDIIFVDVSSDSLPEAVRDRLMKSADNQLIDCDDREGEN